MASAGIQHYHEHSMIKRMLTSWRFKKLLCESVYVERPKQILAAPSALEFLDLIPLPSQSTHQ